MRTLTSGQAWAKKIQPAKMDAFAVLEPRDGRWVQIDTVFYLRGTSPSDVRDGLVNHDGYAPNICVTRRGK